MNRQRYGAYFGLICAAGALSCSEAAAPTEAGVSEIPAFTVAGEQGQHVRVQVCVPANESFPAAAVIEARWDAAVARYGEGMELPPGTIAGADGSSPGRLRLAAVTESGTSAGSCLGSFLLELTGEPGSRTALELELLEGADMTDRNDESLALQSPGLIRIIR